MGTVTTDSHPQRVHPKGGCRPRVISADKLQLALVARKLRPMTRWAALSDGAATASCKPRQPGGGYLIHHGSMLAPMDRGHFSVVLDRVRAQGRAEVLRTWGAGIRTLQAEASSSVMHAGAPA